MSSTFTEKLITIFPVVSGSLSLVGSSLLLCTILRSKKRLSVAYRRIIFGTSIYDVFQSLGLTTSIFLSPEGSRQWAVGNTATCDIQGFFTTIGAIGVPLYLCSLCIYYFCIIRLNMKKYTFRKIEPFLHGVPIIYSFTTGLYALANQYFNNAGSVCYVAPSPITCEIFSDQECTRGEGASQFRLRYLTYPSMAIFVVVCIIMAMITYSAKKMEKRRSRYSFPRPSGLENSPSRCQSFDSKIRNAIFCWRSPSKEKGGNVNTLPDERSPSTASTVSNMRRRSRKKSDRLVEINKQALLYVVSYVVSYGFVWAQSVYILTTKKPAPKSLMVLASIFFPLQGFINIFIYCRPHIVSLQKEFPEEYTWFKAFINVLKSGGDNPLTTRERRFRSTQRASSTFNVPSCAKLYDSDGDAIEEGLELGLGSESVSSEKRGSETKSSMTSPTDIEKQSE